MSREIERYCDAKCLLPGSVRGTETGVGERQRELLCGKFVTTNVGYSHTV